VDPRSVVGKQGKQFHNSVGRDKFRPHSLLTGTPGRILVRQQQLELSLLDWIHHHTPLHAVDGVASVRAPNRNEHGTEHGTLTHVQNKTIPCTPVLQQQVGQNWEVYPE